MSFFPSVESADQKTLVASLLISCSRCIRASEKGRGSRNLVLFVLRSAEVEQMSFILGGQAVYIALYTEVCNY